MKTLVLMRHAKSAWEDPELPDFDRPLAPRGRKAAPRMGAWLRSAGYMPDIVLCSAAKRARETLDLIASSLPKGVKIEMRRELYMAVPREILNLIAKAPAGAATALVVGHNPGLGNFATWLAGSGDAEQLAKLSKKFPTGAIAVLQFPVEDWAEIGGEGGRLLAFVRPRDCA